MCLCSLKESDLFELRDHLSLVSFIQIDKHIVANLIHSLHEDNHNTCSLDIVSFELQGIIRN